jgi:hypothetical protein
MQGVKEGKREMAEGALATVQIHIEFNQLAGNMIVI